ncbi:MAG: DUF502 domain-containing protein [Thiohalomonadaceae bacterium]
MSERPWVGRVQRNLLAGVLTLIPLLITWFVFTFVLRQLSAMGSPGVRVLARALEPYAPGATDLLLHPWFAALVAIVVTLGGLYLLGWAATHVIGGRLIAMFDAMMHRIPLVHTIYGGTKKLLAVLQQKPDQVQRVVLIEFPSPEMKTVGLVTRVFTDASTGRQVAAVYVPTTPNPTSGYLEIVPVEKLVSTDWTMDQAMTFIISGGAVAPEQIHYTHSSAPLKRSATGGE